MEQIAIGLIVIGSVILVVAIHRRFTLILDFIEQQEEFNMTVSDEVAANLEESRQLASVAVSVDANMKALKARVTALEGQIGAATGLSAEDKAALLQSTAFMHDALTTLTADAA